MESIKKKGHGHAEFLVIVISFIANEIGTYWQTNDNCLENDFNHD